MKTIAYAFIAVGAMAKAALAASAVAWDERTGKYAYVSNETSVAEAKQKASQSSVVTLNFLAPDIRVNITEPYGSVFK